LKEYMLKKSIREGRVLCGMSISTPAPSLLEIVGYSGFDFNYVDLEHSVIDLEFLTNMVVASELSGWGLSSVCRIIRGRRLGRRSRLGLME
jgi:4-hydroxy-2-oxoheptanedioate aldolase